MPKFIFLGKFTFHSLSFLPLKRLANIQDNCKVDLKVCMVLAALFLSTLTSNHAFGAITITEIQPLKYPATIKNMNKSTVVVVNWKGKLGGGTNASLLDSDYSQGKYLVSSDTNQPITVDFFQLANEAKVNLKTLRVRYKNKTYKSFPTIELDNPGIDGQIISIGAKVAAGKNATAGEKFPQYVLRVTEQ